MSLIGLIIVLIIIGLLLYLVEFIPMDGTIRQIIRAVVIIVVVLWLVSMLLGVTELGTIRIR